MVRSKAALICAALALVAAPSALAQDTQGGGYGGEVPNLISGGGPGGSGAAGETSSGSLPFTGLDLVLITLGGAALLGTGIALRIKSRRVEQ